MGKTESDWRQEFVGTPVKELIAMFNRDVGHNGWVGARMRFLVKLRVAFLSSGFDCSSFIDAGSMSMAHRVKLVGDRIVPENPDEPPQGGRLVLVKPDP